MVEYTNWINWSGGYCPFPAGTRVDVRFRDGQTHTGHRLADDYHWGHLGQGGEPEGFSKEADIVSYANGIALTPDRTSAPWFQKAWARADMALFLPKVRFVRPDGSTGNSPSNGTCLWASGERASAALRRAAPTLGILATCERLAA